MAKLRPCGNPECSVSTNIANQLSFGSGDLSDYGFWEEPCDTCAREWERNHPEDVPCWPPKEE